MKIVNEILTKGLMANGFKVEIKYIEDGSIARLLAKSENEQWKFSQKIYVPQGHEAQLEAREKAAFAMLLKVAKVYGPPFMNDFLEKDWTPHELEYVMGPFMASDPEKRRDFLKGKYKARILMNSKKGE